MSAALTVLELDCGNSWAKWRLRSPSGDTLVSGAVRRAAPDFPAAIAPDAAGVDDVRVCNVAGASCASALDAWARRRWGVSPRYAAVTVRAAGVTNHYDPPSSLGADRWLACLAAFRRWQRAVCVIDCGTALTVDAVDGHGQCLGGYIAPGLPALFSALPRVTALPDLSVLPDEDPAPGLIHTAPGYNTGAALRAGAWGMVLGLCLGALSEFRRATGPLAVCVTGGHGAALLRRLPGDAGVEVVGVPELVLDGLALSRFHGDAESGERRLDARPE